MKKRFIYFMKPIDLPGPIKIGCSHLPAMRLVALSAWSPFPLEIIAVAPGDMAFEKRLHELFAANLLHREWFDHEPRLGEACEALRRNAPIQSVFPELFDETRAAA